MTELKNTSPLVNENNSNGETYESQIQEMWVGSIPTFEGIVGRSGEIKAVYRKIIQVAPTDTTVLITGETGTGKEMIAQAIHNLSDRREQPYIKVNCASLPLELIESELFGHEKGAFTGAGQRRIGKFEMANGGTIFLDEIGEMPLKLQVKLLRALQEREIERIGGNNTIKLDLRVLAATNRNLRQEVNAQNFRPDLFYRLNVFGISLPPLRERTGDVELLVKYLLKVKCEKLKKNIEYISDQSLERLKEYSWPGNVRELEHVIERAVIISNGPTLDVGFPVSPSSNRPDDTNDVQIDGPNSLKTLEEYQRDYILYVLKYTNGKIRGQDGAAEILDLHPSTLDAKIKKLGIKKSAFEIE